MSLLAKDTISCWSTQDIENAEIKLLNVVCATLLYEPRYYSSADSTRTRILEAAKIVAKGEPEFLLKLALYVRDDLNIRSTTNFLVAIAATIEECRPFLKYYFSKTVRLPTDLFEIVALVKMLNNDVIPASLRSVVVEKFAEFDVYQLAKYNKEKAIKRKKRKAKLAAERESKKKVKSDTESEEAEAETAGGSRGRGTRGRGRGRGRGGRGGQQPEAAADPAETKPTLPTLKQLIRMFHISEPVDAVMAILGKKYPATEEDFVKSRLPGTFDPTLANKRMKLPTPVTWETELSAMGNNNNSWSKLIDAGKLPFMAMLRNLRNILLCDLDEKYHNLLIDTRLTNENAVAASRQFPFRFLSAYEVIDQLEKGQLSSSKRAESSGGRGQRQQQQPVETEEQRARREAREARFTIPPKPLLTRYKSALDVSVKLAISRNMKPIRGYTLAMCDISGSMQCPVSSAKGACGSVRQAYDISILMGLMLKYICERCDMYLFGTSGRHPKPYYKLTIPDDSILGLLSYCKAQAHQHLSGGNEFFYELFEELMASKTVVDRMVIFSDVMIDGLQSQGSVKHGGIEGIVAKYRATVNPDFAFVMVDLFGSGRSLVSVDPNVKHPKDILISGYSDQIFRFLADKDSDQLSFVKSIDTVKNIPKTAEALKAAKEKRQQIMAKRAARAAASNVESDSDAVASTSGSADVASELDAF